MNNPWKQKRWIGALLASLFLGAGFIYCSSSKNDLNEDEDGMPSPSSGYNAGLRIFDFDYVGSGGKIESVTVAVWYPTEEKPHPFTYPAEENCMSRVAPDASIAGKGGPYPLIVFVHGAYGSGYNSAYFMEYLARCGYICAAADYSDTIPPAHDRQIAFSRIKEGNTGHPVRVVAIAGRFVREMNRDREALLSYLAKHRLPLTSFVIDTMLDQSRRSGSTFHQAVKEDAIGICGHSLGGATTLGKIGAHPDETFEDDRIKAALIFSAPGYPFEDGLNNIDVPLMLMVGEYDSPGLCPDLPRRVIYDRAGPPKYYLVSRGGTHFTFGNRGCGKLPLYEAVESIDQMNAICRYGLAFFEKYVRMDPSAGDPLKDTDPAWAYYLMEERADEASEWGKEPPPGKGGPGGIRYELRKPFRGKSSGDEDRDDANDGYCFIGIMDLSPFWRPLAPSFF